jgi:hypothetical protein
MNEKMKKYIPLFVVLGLLLLGAGIYIIVNHVGMATRVGYSAEPANFWLGLWQGAIIFLSFIASWFDKNIVLYQVHNNGLWYNIGFMIGLVIAIGSGAKGSNNKDEKKKAKSKPMPECK